MTTNILLRKISQLPAIRPRQREAVARVLGVFENLPRISEELHIAVSLAALRHFYGEHKKISHWWRVAVAGNELEVYFYRPSTGGDSFTYMEWHDMPGREAAYDDWFDRHRIVDDAQPCEIEVAGLAITEPGYWLSVELDGEELGSEEDEECEEKRNEEPEPPMTDAQHATLLTCAAGCPPSPGFSGAREFLSESQDVPDVYRTIIGLPL